MKGWPFLFAISLLLISCNGDTTSSPLLSMSDASLLYVSNAGATMTGQLNLPLNGLTVGTSQLAALGGKVGIGTTNPAFLLHVDGTISNTYTSTSGTSQVPDGLVTRFQNSYSGDGSFGGFEMRVLRADGVTQRAYMGVVSNTAGEVPDIVIGQQTGGAAYAERMRVTSAGNVGIGTTSPSGILDVNQTTAGSVAIQAQNAGTAFWKVLRPTGGATNTWNAGNSILYVGMDTGTSRSINAAGTVNASGADFAEWVDWSGPQPEMGSIINYKGSHVVVSSPETAAFVGNDTKDPKHAILIAFAGQLPVLVRGKVHEGDLIIANKDGTGTAVNKDKISLKEARTAVGTAWESSSDLNLKRVNVAVGIGLGSHGEREFASLKAENESLKARLEKIEQMLKSN